MSASADMCALKFDSSFVRRGKCGNRMPLRPSPFSSLVAPPLRGRQSLLKEGVLFLSQCALWAPPDSNKASEEALLSARVLLHLLILFIPSYRTVVQIVVSVGDSTCASFGVGVGHSLPFRMKVGPLSALPSCGWVGPSHSWVGVPLLRVGLALPFRVWRWPFLLGWPFPLFGWGWPSFSSSRGWPVLLGIGVGPSFLGLALPSWRWDAYSVSVKV